ncbi:MAG: discoidin domain-containing protein [Acutalibacteraceae bacterium]
MKKFLATFLAVALAAVACCVFASAEDTNIALGKSYTTIGIYLLETETQPIYIDEEGKTLTDGVKATAGLAYQDPLWVGFNMNSPDAKDNGGVCEIEIDLGGDAKVSGFAVEVYLPEKAGAGISAPSKVEFFYSADGEEWTSAGEGVDGERLAERRRAGSGRGGGCEVRQSRACSHRLAVHFRNRSDGHDGRGHDGRVKSETESRPSRSGFLRGARGVLCGRDLFHGFVHAFDV